MYVSFDMINDEGKLQSFISRIKYQSLDVNECQLSDFYCGEKGVCKNLVGSYECECADGFQRDQYTGQCVDIDECK